MFNTAYFFKNVFIYGCAASVFSSWEAGGGGGYFLVAMHGLLIAVASLVAEHQL